MLSSLLCAFHHLPLLDVNMMLVIFIPKSPKKYNVTMKARKGYILQLINVR